MSDKSPLFVSALELLAHATELYALGHTRKYKFSILHLANAVELILKDCLVDHGVSIYKNPKETITIWGAFEELEKLGIRVPERSVIELLIDDRNTIQHRFGYPNAEAVYYYLEQVVAFFGRFLEEQYKVSLAEALDPHLSRENLALIGLVKDEYNQLKHLFRLSPDAAIQQAYKLVEVRLWRIARTTEGWREMTSDKQRMRRSMTARDLMNLVAGAGLVDKTTIEQFELLRDTRNFAAHFSMAENATADWDGALKAAFQVLAVLDKVVRTLPPQDSGDLPPSESQSAA